MLSETSKHLLQRPCDEQGGSQQNSECIWSAWWSANHGKETETQMVWPHLKILWHGEDNSAGDSERSKEERKTEEEMGRSHQGMDGNGVWRFPRGSGRQEVWSGIFATSSVVPRRTQRLRDWDEMRWDEMNVSVASVAYHYQNIWEDTHAPPPPPHTYTYLEIYLLVLNCPICYFVCKVWLWVLLLP